MDGGAWWAVGAMDCSPWGRKELGMTERLFTGTGLTSLVAQRLKHLPAFARNVGDLGSIPGLGRSLEKETATHSSILAWRIPWTEEPGGLQSTGLQRVRHD